MRIVAALGGNALLKRGEPLTVHNQRENVKIAARALAPLAREHSLIITHGNGPQVGHALIRVEETRKLVPPIPLGVIVADLEGGMGYMIEQSLYNKLLLRNVRRPVVTILAQVIVDRDDPSILNPSKFVGPFYKKKQVEELTALRGYIIREDPGRGYRRVVPSPIPKKIVESDIIRRLVHDGAVVITVGGGGIPVYIEKDGRLEGVDAVIDKDLASAVLAEEIGAEELYILTAVDRVALNFGKPNQQELDVMTISEAKHHLTEGQFPGGSMGPKIRAAINFLEKGGRKVIITSVERMNEAIDGRTGTRIVADA